MHIKVTVRKQRVAQRSENPRLVAAEMVGEDQVQGSARPSSIRLTRAAIFLVCSQSFPHVIEEAPIDLVDDLHEAGRHDAKPLDRPSFEGLGKQCVVGVSERFLSPRPDPNRDGLRRARCASTRRLPLWGAYRSVESRLSRGRHTNPGCRGGSGERDRRANKRPENIPARIVALGPC